MDQGRTHPYIEVREVLYSNTHWKKRKKRLIFFFQCVFELDKTEERTLKLTTKQDNEKLPAYNARYNVPTTYHFKLATRLSKGPVMQWYIYAGLNKIYCTWTVSWINLAISIEYMLACFCLASFTLYTSHSTWNMFPRWRWGTPSRNSWDTPRGSRTSAHP